MAVGPVSKTKASHSISLPVNAGHAAETLRFQREIRTKDARIQLLEGHLVTLATGLTEIEKDRKRLQAQVRSSPGRPKPDRSSTTSKKTWPTRSTPQVREDLSALEQRMRSWAIKNSVADVADLDHLDGEDKNILLEHLDGFCAETDWDALLQATPIVLHRVPALLTQALLSKDVFARAFMNPFFAFPTEDPTGRLPTSRMMKTLYATMLEGKTRVPVGVAGLHADRHVPSQRNGSPRVALADAASPVDAPVRPERGELASTASPRSDE